MESQLGVNILLSYIQIAAKVKIGEETCYYRCATRGCYRCTILLHEGFQEGLRGENDGFKAWKGGCRLM